MGLAMIRFCPQASEAFHTVESFENEFAKKIGTKYCVAVNSGYSALFIALKSCGIMEGDEVIVPDFTMIATANAVKECGAKPVFVEVDRRGNIDVEKITVTNKTKAVIGVHVYGHPFNCDLTKFCKKNNLILIEDAAESHGAKSPVGNVGTIGKLGCFSFYSNKIISTGEGGAITTNDKVLAEKARQLRSYCFTEGYKHDEIGYGMRMNAYGALHGLKMLKNWNKHVNQRAKTSSKYNKLIKYGIKPTQDKGYKNVYWMYGLLVDKKDELRRFLLKNGVETRDFFYPISLQKPYGGKLVSKVAKDLNDRGILLPIFTKNVRRVSNLINQFYEDER